MIISITYCAQWNYKPQAVSLAAKIEKALGSSVELIPEGKGVFDISVDGNLEYSKYLTGIFPEEGQLVKTLISKYKPE